MVQFDFDTPLHIQNIWSRKWDYREAQTGVPDVQPMWIADMDFETVPAVQKAIQQRAQLGIYGYTAVDADYHQAVIGWLSRRHGWQIQSDWLVHTPSVICGIQTAVRAFSTKEDLILIQPPVYHPFFRLIHQTRRRVLENPLIDRGDHYDIDWEDLEAKLRDFRPKIFILCNPHNPIGKIYTQEELKRMGDLSAKYGVLLIVDEIHGDLIAPQAHFTSYGTLGESYAQSAIICTAPSKTFNLAGLHLSNIIIPHEKLRRDFLDAFHEAGIADPNVFSLVAANAAFREGDSWVDALTAYLWQNRQLAETYIRENIPQITAYRGTGTYFLWLDCRKLHLCNQELEQFLLKKAKIWANQGHIFGKQGSGFVRLNLALPASQLKEALERLKEAVQTL